MIDSNQSAIIVSASLRVLPCVTASKSGTSASHQRPSRVSFPSNLMVLLHRSPQNRACESLVDLPMAWNCLFALAIGPHVVLPAVPEESPSTFAQATLEITALHSVHRSVYEILVDPAF